MWALYGVYLRAGGEKKASYDKTYKRYAGAPLFFVQAAVEQIKPLVPDALRDKILPKEPKALTRAIYAAMTSDPATGNKPSKN